MNCCKKKKKRRHEHKLSFTSAVDEIRESAQNILGSPSTKITQGEFKSLVKHNVYRNSSQKETCCDKIPIIHPFGPFRLIWDSFVITLLLYTSIEVPYTLTFGVILQLNEASGIIALTIDLLLLFDILLNFRTAYVDKYDHLHIITSPKSIAKRYIKSWFLLDLVSSLPFEFMIPIFLGQAPTDNDRTLSEFFKILRIFRLLRGLKMLRVLRIFKLFKGYGRYFFVRETAMVLKCIRCLAAMLITAHYFACFWYLVGWHTKQKGKDSWLQIIDSEHEDPSNFTKYSYSWYWAIVTLFTTGYGDIVAYNEEEQWTASACILIGTCFFAYFIGILTTLLEEGDRVRMYELERVEEAQLFCAHHRLPRQLARAIISHIRYYCNYNYVFDHDRIMASIPTYLQNHVTSHLGKSLMGLDIFKHLPPPVIGQIALKMTSLSCNSGHTLFKKGELSHEFFIQRTGRSILHIQPNKIDRKHTRILERGDVCGEYAILSGKHRDTVKCLTWSEFYVLDINDLISVLRENFLDPKAFHRAYSQIKVVLRKTLRKATSRKVKFKATMGDHAEFIHELSPDATRSTIYPYYASRTDSANDAEANTNSPAPLYHKMSKPMWSKPNQHSHGAIPTTTTATETHEQHTNSPHTTNPDDNTSTKGLYRPHRIPPSDVDSPNFDTTEPPKKTKSFDFTKLKLTKSATFLRNQKSSDRDLYNTPKSVKSDTTYKRGKSQSSRRILRTFSGFLTREDSAERHDLVIKKPNAFGIEVERVDTTHREFEYSDHEESHFHRDVTMDNLRQFSPPNAFDMTDPMTHGLGLGLGLKNRRHGAKGITTKTRGRSGGKFGKRRKIQKQQTRKTSNNDHNANIVQGLKMRSQIAEMTEMMTNDTISDNGNSSHISLDTMAPNNDMNDPSGSVELTALSIDNSHHTDDEADDEYDLEEKLDLTVSALGPDKLDSLQIRRPSNTLTVPPHDYKKPSNMNNEMSVGSLNNLKVDNLRSKENSFGVSPTPSMNQRQLHSRNHSRNITPLGMGKQSSLNIIKSRAKEELSSKFGNLSSNDLDQIPEDRKRKWSRDRDKYKYKLHQDHNENRVVFLDGAENGGSISAELQHLTANDDAASDSFIYSSRQKNVLPDFNKTHV